MKGQWSGTTGGWKRMSKERKKEIEMGYTRISDVGGLMPKTATGMLEFQKARTDKVAGGKRYIPLSALEALGSIFLEGVPKYGEHNWKNGAGDKKYQLERWEHADRHLHLWVEGDRTENHLAKVMWFCATQIELERMEREKEEIARENQCATPINPDELFKGNLEEPPLPSPESLALGEEGVEDVLKDLGIAVGKEALSAAIERFLKALKDNREKERGKEMEKGRDTSTRRNAVFIPPAPEKEVNKKARKRVISEEGKERIAAAQRKRWAKVRREKKAQEKGGK